MAHEVQCKLCGQLLSSCYGAHECPHGELCRFKVGSDHLPLDWKTLECPKCKPMTKEGVARAWVPTPRGWDYEIPPEIAARVRERMKVQHGST